MAAQKTRALVLQVMPYQESSGILYLHTEELGLVHGLARGIRRPTKSSQPVERGSLIECMVYTKPNRSLQTLGTPTTLEHYPGIRGDLLKTALRDSAFEMVLRSSHPEEPHLELFGYLCRYLAALDTGDTSELFPFALWRFYTGYLSLMGLGIDFSSCSHCARRMGPEEAGHLLVERGTVLCRSCAGVAVTRGALAAEVRVFLARHSTPASTLATVSGEQQRGITRQLSNFCRHHFEMDRDLNSLDFFCSLI